MKRTKIKNLILYLAILSLFILVMFSFYGILKEQIRYNQGILIRQVESSGRKIEELSRDFVDELRYYLTINEFQKLIQKENAEYKEAILIKKLYAKYQDLIELFEIYNNKNYRMLKKDKHNYFTVSKLSHPEKEMELLYAEKIVKENRNLIYTIPGKSFDGEYINIRLKLNLGRFILSEIKKFYIGRNSWYWIIDSKGEVIDVFYSERRANINDFKVEGIDGIKEDIKNGYTGISEHKIYSKKYYNVMSVYYPVNIYGEKLGIIFSLDKSTMTSYIIFRMITMIISFLLMIVIIIYIFINFLNENRLMSEKLRKSEETMKQIIESVPIPVVLLNKKKIITGLNKAAILNTGYFDKEDLIGKDFSKIVILQSDIEKELEKNNVRASKEKLIKASGEEIDIIRTVVLIDIGSKDVYLETFLDISDIERARKAAENANRSKSEFLANMSHEIRTPLNAIIGFAGLLVEEEYNQEKLENLKIISKSGKHLLELINDILDFSKIEANKMEINLVVFSFKELIKNISKMFFNEAHKKDIDFVIDISNEFPDYVLGDEYRIKQILLNLLSNAFKFTKKGKIEILCDYEYEKTNITVRDSGIGIAKEKQKKIFLPFQQSDNSTTREYGGTGLGLAIVKKLINLMGGTIELKSELNQGAEFNISLKLPEVNKIRESISEEIFEDETDYINSIDIKELDILLKEIDNIEGALKNQSIGDLFLYFRKFERLVKKIKIETLVKRVEQIKKELEVDFLNEEKIYFHFKVLRDYIEELFGEIFEKEHYEKIKHLKILVAEDNNANQKYIKKLLTSFEIEHDMVKNGEDALKMMNIKNYDIVLLDIQMPVMGGFEFIKILRNVIREEEIYVVAVSANVMEEDVEKMIKAGCNDYLEKPFEKATFIKKIYKYFLLKNNGGKIKIKDLIEKLEENIAIFSPELVEKYAMDLIKDELTKEIGEKMFESAKKFDDIAFEEEVEKLKKLYERL